jgi:hypothetical protein
MEGTGQDAPRRFGVRWLAGALGIAVGAAAVVFFAPSSSAATTVDAQLSLTGIATQGNILGGTTVGVHPGDTVNFQAAAVPTAGLDNIPALGPLLDDLVTTLLHTQYQVVLHLPANFPGGARDVTLGGPTTGACKGTAKLPVQFVNAGTYQFTWNVQYVLPGLLGCTKNGLNKSDLNLLKGIGVALNSTNQWVGQIVVAANPPPPGISIQLPGVNVAPNVAGNQLPTISVPNINLPTIPVDVPSIVGGLPSLGGSKTPTPTDSGGTPTTGSTSGTECVPCTVVPNPGLGSPGGGNVGFGPGPDSGGILPIGGGLHPTSSAEQPSATPTPSTSKSITKRVDLASNKAPSAQVPVVLAIIAIIALALVTATYARLYLLRRGAA